MVNSVTLLLFGALLCIASGLASAQTPQRVVSMNLCTDQLAMLVAKPGQLISVSHLSVDPTASLMVERAQSLIINHGLAEQVIRLKPDLVIAGTYTTRTTVNLLKRLDVRVVEFEPANSLEDVRTNLTRMGKLLGRQPQAVELIRAFNQQLVQASVRASSTRALVGSYGANSYTGGAASLESQIVKTAGFEHLGSKLQLQGTSKLPLESLILADPDIVMSWQRWSEGSDRAVEVLQHPALDRWFGQQRRISVDSRYWICGTPYTVKAIRQLQQAIAEKEPNHE